MLLSWGRVLGTVEALTGGGFIQIKFLISGSCLVSPTSNPFSFLSFFRVRAGPLPLSSSSSQFFFFCKYYVTVFCISNIKTRVECITIVLFTQDNMAAPMRLAARPLEFLLYQQARSLRHNVSQNVIRNFSSGKSFWKNSGYGRKVLVAGSVAVAGVTLTALGQRWSPYWQTVHAASATSPSIVRPDIEPSRKVRQDIMVHVCMSCWTTVFHIQSLTRAPRFFFFHYFPNW